MKILITKEHVLAAQKERGMPNTNSCAMHQALRPFIKEVFSVIDGAVFISDPYQHFAFEPDLPYELYISDFQQALEIIEKHGPYEFEVSGL